MRGTMAYDPDIAITLWPEYFDINRTRSEGRLEYEVREDMSYPKAPRARHGCVKVERGVMSKTELLPKIGEILVSNQRK